MAFGRVWLSISMFLLAAALQWSSVNAVVRAEDTEPELPVVAFYPETLDLITEGKTVQVMWYTNITDNAETVDAKMAKWREAEVADFGEPIQGTPQLEDANATDILSMTDISYYGYVNVTAKFVGFNTLLVKLYNEVNETVAEGEMAMTVKLKSDNLITIYTYVVGVTTAVVYFLMGMTIDLQVVKGIAKRPVGPAVGIFCQYIMMPLISFGLGLALYSGDSFEERLMRLGMFLSGCCPGGGASNMWTHLLGGSLDLSCMMTCVSTFVSFASVPLWVLTLGPVIMSDADFVIPYIDITITVISLIIPCGVGILLQAKFPGSRMVRFCSKMMSPFCAMNLILIFTFGTYCYLYIFTLFDWRTLVAGIALPTLGYTAGSIFAALFRMDTARIIAVGVETGVQNYTIALVILILTVSSPAGEIATALPGAFMLFTPLPLLILLFIRKSYLWYRNRHSDKLSPSTGLKDVPGKTGVSKGVAHHQSDVEKKGSGIDNLAAELNDKV